MIGFSSVAQVSAASSADVLNWNIFTKSNAILEENGKGKRLDCDAETIQTYIVQSQVDLEGYEGEVENLKDTDPGYLRDIKGCIMQDKVDGFATWSIYIVIMGLIIYMIFSLWAHFLGGWNSSNNDSMGMDPSSGGNNEILDKIKTPLLITGALFLIVLGAVNKFLELVAWLLDAVLG